MKQVLIKDGRAFVDTVPAPTNLPGNLLIKTRYSAISAGTEMAGVIASGMPLYRRVLRQPENVAKVVQMVKDEGLSRTVQRVRGKLSSGSATGYSAAGIVAEVGEDIVGFAVGDRVACAGAGYANHAEYNSVPVNLCVKVPANVSLRCGSTVTLGAIAMQGIRRANPQIGETFVVLGLGLLGQITAQILKAHGCRVIGIDLDQGRINLAKKSGLWKGLNASTTDPVAKVHQLTNQFGADATIIAAAGSSNDIISTAAKCCRKKGRVVLVGDVGLHLKRSDFYSKEVDFLISCSYGPGRYDPVYEEGGQDYPLPYVRWTENRNMAEFLRLIEDQLIDLDPLLQNMFSLDNAEEAYNRLKDNHNKPILALLEYDKSGTNKQSRIITLTSSKKVESTRIRTAVVGAGGFAQAVHLPNFRKLRSHFELIAIVSRTGSNAKAVAKTNGAEFAATSMDDLLEAQELDLVLISTRHDLHAPMILKALDRGINVFVEKPLAINRKQFEDVKSWFERSGGQSPILLTGFNRRFSPALLACGEILRDRIGPMIVNYRMNAGHIPKDHWVHGAEGGGRNIGEACHIYDLFNSLTSASTTDVSAYGVPSLSREMVTNDNFVASIKYDDGSVCTLTYTSIGNKKFPKEQMEIFCDGFVISMDDYKSLTVSGTNGPTWHSRAPDKGHFKEMEALAKALKSGGKWPISLEEQFLATEISLQVEDQIVGS